MLRRFLLIAGLAACVYFALQQREAPPADVGSSPTVTTEKVVAETAFELGAARERLFVRLDEYIELRKADDWYKLYDSTVPKQRTKVPRNNFLMAYGNGYTRVHDIEIKDVRIAPEGQIAVADLIVDAEIVVENLPEQFRTGFQQANSPEDLRQQQPFTLSWVWENGDWYFELDNEVVSGRAANGSEVEFFDASR